MSDWINSFMEYSAGLPSPELLRQWTAISTVGALMERRCSMKLSAGHVFPNLFILLVAPPAVGKTVAIEQARDIVRSTRKINLAPKSTTKAALLDLLVKSAKKVPSPNGKELLEYSSLYAASPEFGVLVPIHDNAFFSVLNDIYDNPSDFDDKTRHSKSVEIIHPQLNILAGAQPGYLANMLPEETWSMGFMSRVLMIYAEAGPRADVFNGVEMNSAARQNLLNGAMTLATMQGQFSMQRNAMTEVQRWHDTGLEPMPDHNKLQNYNGRRLINAIKLMMISSASRGEDMVITLGDVNRARDWLLSAEIVMPDVFMAMAGKNDSQIIQDLHHFMWKIWAKGKKPLHESTLINFLRHRTTTEKIMKIIEIAERSNVLQRETGTSNFIPLPLTNHGVQ